MSIQESFPGIHTSVFDPKITDEKAYAAFKDDVKENHLYFEWDLLYGSCYDIYEIMRLINDLLNENHLQYDDVRLMCHVS